jgi:hypothetical protein
MESPIVICNGVIRSGSTWSFNVCRLLGHLLARRRREVFAGAYLSAEILDRFLTNDVDARKGPAVIKAHEIGPLALEWIRTGRAKAVCTVRDPRDCVASDIAFWGAGFETSVGRVTLSLKFISSCCDFGRTLFVRYEEMMDNRRAEIAKIANYLRIPVGPAEIEWIDRRTDIRSSEEICRELMTRPAKETEKISNNHRRDPITLLHDNHLGSGKVGRWKEDLTAEQGRVLTQLFNRSLNALGYSSEEPNDIPPIAANAAPAETISGIASF